jgi:dihydrofolate reductase
MSPPSGVVVTLIALLSKDGYISEGVGVPFDLPEDRQHFRDYAAGKWLLLGRRTYVEMIGWFRNHVPLVLSRDSSFQPAIGRRVASVQEAIEIARENGQTELVVCGGGAAYEAAISAAEKLVITRVDRLLGRGVMFPSFDQDGSWRLEKRDEHGGALPFSIEVYWRKRADVII